MKEDHSVSANGTLAPEPPCVRCGLQVPTKWVEFRQNIGMVVTRRTAKVSGYMCRRCLRAYFKSYTLTTLFLGWWGVISFLVTPVFLFNNLVQFSKSLNLPQPSPAVANVPIDSSPARISVGAGSLKFKLIYGVIIWAAVLAFAAEQSVEFVEKHAPSLNAKLHSGAITDASDGEYAGLKIGEDIVALEAPIKSKEWSAIRTEYLAREPYLDDLESKNAKLQSAGASERGNGVAANDPCELMSLNQFFPSVNEYTNASVQLFSLLKSTTTPTQAIDALVDRQDAARKRMSAYFSEEKAKGCEK